MILKLENCYNNIILCCVTEFLRLVANNKNKMANIVVTGHEETTEQWTVTPREDNTKLTTAVEGVSSTVTTATTVTAATTATTVTTATTATTVTTDKETKTQTQSSKSVTITTNGKQQKVESSNKIRNKGSERTGDTEAKNTDEMEEVMSGEKLVSINLLLNCV